MNEGFSGTKSTLASVGAGLALAKEALLERDVTKETTKDNKKCYFISQETRILLHKINLLFDYDYQI